MKEEFSAPELVLDLEAYWGLTPWENAAKKPPGRIGWYKTRRVDAPKLMQGQRRWWDGTAFSRPVLLGWSDEDAATSMVQVANVEAVELEWCGLKGPYPGFEE